MSSSLPKLSYVLLSHNREKYIRAAIESAFAQDYEGELEYIFSDDCSTDRTFEIIQECVAAYKGNRRVVVTQTPKNLHLAGNTNHAVQFVESDWVIRADDDDISHVSRCSIIGKAVAENPGSTYVFTKMQRFIDSEYHVVLESSKKVSPTAHPVHIFQHGLGCKESVNTFAETDCLHQAWHADIYRKFGDLPIAGYYVDDVISHYRAMSLGFGVFVNHVAAFIRSASNNMSRGGDIGERGYVGIMKLEKFHDTYFNTVLAPLKETRQQLLEFVNPDSMPLFFDQLNQFISRHELYASFWRHGIINRFRITRKYSSSLDLFSLLRCLPMPVFAFLLAMIRQLKRIIK